MEAMQFIWFTKPGFERNKYFYINLVVLLFKRQVTNSKTIIGFKSNIIFYRLFVL